ncbi:putative srpk [Byssothecium circinans]|uniref:non-specific serine/threonine protein kinase n=1 Tax=Byssothecium circinans TaxID=147558 RepID=A0A6A5T7P2_9PLEO|nr:putative srpk [Byssothecium circinans]KAF1948231.1 putative srpk [Byssothecium circinans]
MDEYKALRNSGKLEPLEHYSHGGYHPIHIGDKLHSAQYTIVNKLGWGGSSTVWLATDAHDKNACVVISISKASMAKHCREVLMPKIDYLRAGDDEHPGKKHIIFPKEFFMHESCNGRHFCLVMDFEGQVVSRATNRGQGAATRPLPLARAKEAILDLGDGLRYMHDLGMAHNDIYGANLYLGLTPNILWTARTFEKMCGPPRKVPISRHAFMASNQHVPRYLVTDALTSEIDAELFSGPLKIGDFELAVCAGDSVSRFAQGPWMLPEHNTPQHIDTAGDIWMFACAIYQFLSGFDLMGEYNDPLPKIVNQTTSVLGKPPEWIIESWKEKYGKGSIRVSETPTKPLWSCVREIRDGNMKRGMKARKHEFSDTHIETLTDLLCFMLQFDPSDRPDIGEVLAHPSMEYFREQCKLAQP